MKKIVVSRNGIQTHGASLPDEEYQQWIDQNIQNNSWGRPERWVSESELAEDELISDAIDSEERSFGVGLTYTFYKFKADYVISVTDDVSSSDDAELAYKKRARDFVEDLIDYILLIIDKKNLDQGESIAIMANSQIQTILGLLRLRSLIYSRGVINQMDESIFSAVEKAAIVDKMTAFLVANGKE